MKPDLDGVIQLVTSKGTQFAISVLTAGAILFFGRLVARALIAGFERVLSRSHTDPTLVRFLCNLLYAVILLLVSLAALERLGVNTTSFAAVLAAGGLAIGLALQGSLSNFAAGVMIILFRHFRAGDVVEAGGQKGVVREMQIFWTVLTAEDGTRVIVPNSAITGAVIKVFPPAAATEAKKEAAAG